nr:ATP-binding protein [Streptomyces violens]
MSSATVPLPLPAPAAFHVRLDCCPEAVAKARDLTVAFLRGLSPPLLQDAADAVELVVSELVTNAVRHSGGRSCSLRLSADSDSIVVTVRDSSTLPPRLREPDFSGEGGGFGWGLVRGLARTTAVTEEANGKVVTAVLPRRERPVHARVLV